MLKAALIGAGNRGKDVYGEFALTHPNEIQFVAVADTDDARRREFARKHSIKDEYSFASWDQLLAKPKFCDVIFVCTQDRFHHQPACEAMKIGYDILLEKPMATTMEGCTGIVEQSKKYNRNITVAHVLRYSPFFQKLKEIIKSKIIGEVTTVNLNENIAYWHYAHSYVRGNWGNVEQSSPILLAKSSHDMDILVWIIGKKPLNITSFGSLKYFKKENAPEGSGERCLECGIENECSYSAAKLYLGENIDWPVSVISNDLSIEGRIQALKEGPYGRCVFKCDNDAVDHQIVNIEFAEGIVAGFTLSAFTHDLSRSIRIMGTSGEISGNLEEGKIEINLFGSSGKVVYHLPASPGRHSGGDFGMMKSLTHKDNDNVINGLTSAEVSLISHIMCFAAEKARLEGKVVNIDDFKGSYITVFQ